MGLINTGILTTAPADHLVWILQLVMNQAADAEPTITGILLVAVAKHLLMVLRLTEPHRTEHHHPALPKKCAEILPDAHGQALLASVHKEYQQQVRFFQKKLQKNMELVSLSKNLAIALIAKAVIPSAQILKIEKSVFRLAKIQVCMMKNRKSKL